MMYDTYQYQYQPAGCDNSEYVTTVNDNNKVSDKRICFGVCWQLD